MAGRKHSVEARAWIDARIADAKDDPDCWISEATRAEVIEDCIIITTDQLHDIFSGTPASIDARRKQMRDAADIRAALAALRAELRREVAS